MNRALKDAKQVTAILRAALAARAAGDATRAAREVARARRIEPDNPDVLHIAAIVAYDSGQTQEALRTMRRAVARRPSDSTLHRSLGLIARSAHAPDEAISALRISLAAHPADREAARILSALLTDRGAFEEALATLYALPLDLRDLDWDYDAARLCALTARHAEVVQILSRVRRQRPKDIKLLLALAHSLIALNRPGDAGLVFSDALSIDANPSDGAILARAYARFRAANGDDDLADQFFAVAAMLEPEVPEHRIELIQFAASRPRFRSLATWHAIRLAELIKDPAALRGVVPDISTVPIYLDEFGSRSFEECGRIGQGLARSAEISVIDPLSRRADPDRRLRIGYFSGDFRLHAAAKFSLPLIEAHDRANFEIFGYADGDCADEVSERFSRSFDQWVPLNTGSESARIEAAKQICRDKVDILIDLMGLTSESGPVIFMQRPAPVQVTYLGYPATTGLACFDARFCDEATDPPGRTDSFFVERLLRLDRLFLAYAPFRTTPDPSPDPPVLRDGCITFGSFNNPAKMTKATIAMWAKVINAVTGSRLLVRNNVFENDPAVAADLRRMFSQAGIAAGRVEILPRAASEDELLASYREIDIALDTFPYSGTTTTCDALWMGVPVVTRAGAPHASRVSLAILRAVGLPELAAESDQGFVAACVRLARDPALLRETRRDLRARVQASPLGDHAGLARSIERAYRELWRRWCARTGGSAGAR